jgi:hypothetical protein
MSAKLLARYASGFGGADMTDREFLRLCEENSFGAVARGECPAIPPGMLKALLEAAVTEAYSAWRAEGEALVKNGGPIFALGSWWADRPWRNRSKPA